jgi:DNA primase
MASVVLPDLVRSVVIGADNDDTGRAVARKAGEAFALQGRDARIIFPTAPHKDFNAELSANGMEAR